MLGWRAEPSCAPLYCSTEKWEVLYLSPKSTPVFSAENPHSHGVCEGLPQLVLSWKHPWVRQFQAVLLCCGSKAIMPKGTPRALITCSPPKSPLCTKRNITVLGTWQKTLLKGRNNLTATPSHLWPSGGVLGWLRGSKNLTFKEKTCSIFCEDEEHFW